MNRKEQLVGFLAMVGIASMAAWWCTRPGGGEANPAAAPAANGQRSPVAAPLDRSFSTVPLHFDDDPTGDQRLEGQVIDADEQPVAGAVVVVDSNPRRETMTQEDGSFYFDRLVARGYRLEARHGGRIAGPVDAQLAPASDPVVLRLRDAAAVDVEVVADGQPVVGAQVELRGLSLVAAATGDDGHARIAGVGPGYYPVVVTAAGFATSFTRISATGSPGSVESHRVELQPAVAVSGTVTDATGAPVEGARVMPESLAEVHELPDPRLDSVVTDVKGRWRFDSLPRETVRFSASHPRYAPGVSTPVALSDGVDRTDVAIVVDAGARVAGKVVGSAGQPAPSAMVHVGEAASWGPVRHVMCAADGSFAITGLPRRTVHLVARSADGSSALLPVDLTAEPNRDDVVLTLEHSGRIAGVVVDQAGEPVPEARVAAVPEITDDVSGESKMRLRGVPATVADAAGGFELTGLEGGSYFLKAIRPGATPDTLWMGQGSKVASGDENVRLQVWSTTRVEGVVAFADGSHPEVFSVGLGNAHPATFVGTDGAFSLEEVVPGVLGMSVTGPELVDEIMSEVTVEADRDNDLGVITVRSGRSISGRVVDPTGQPVAGATVIAGTNMNGDGVRMAGMRDNQQGFKSAITGADGTFLLAGVGAAPTAVMAEHSSHGRSVAAEVPGGAGDGEVVLQLQAFAALEGRITRNGQPTQVMVGLRPHAAVNAQFRVFTGPDGRFRFDRLAPGRYLAYAYAERGTRMSGGGGEGRDVVLAPGETAEIEIDVPVGDVALTVTMESDDASVKYGYAAVAATDKLTEPVTLTIDAARKLIAGQGSMRIQEGFMVENKSITFEKMVPGRYGACMMPIRGDPRDPAAVAAMSKNTVMTQMRCVPLTITASPLAQQVVVDVSGVEAK